jgi:hypothetical protein
MCGASHDRACAGFHAHTHGGVCRGRLSALSKQQFEELAVDVCDEVRRRLAVSAGTRPPPVSLTADGALQPSRIEARTRMTTFNADKFRDLVLDILVELGGRFPAVLEAVAPELRAATGAGNVGVRSAGPSGKAVGTTVGAASSKAAAAAATPAAAPARGRGGPLPVPPTGPAASASPAAVAAAATVALSPAPTPTSQGPVPAPRGTPQVRYCAVSALGISMHGRPSDAQTLSGRGEPCG